MIRHLSAVALIAAATTVFAPRADAQFTNACGGGAFFTCVNLAVSGQGTSTLLFTVANSSNHSPANNPNSTFKEFGVGNGSFTGTAPTVTSTGTLGSHFTTASTNPSSFSGFGYTANNFFGLTPNVPVPANGLHDGQSVGFFLAFANATDASNFLNGFQFAVHDIGGLTDACGSNKAAFSSNGTPLTGSTAPTNAATCNPSTPPSTVPEPSSIALLGTGLFGLVPMVRRRRK